MTENERVIELMKKWCVQKCTVECLWSPGAKACQECSVLGVGKLLNIIDDQETTIERLTAKLDTFTDIVSNCIEEMVGK